MSAAAVAPLSPTSTSLSRSRPTLSLSSNAAFTRVRTAASTSASTTTPQSWQTQSSHEAGQDVGHDAESERMSVTSSSTSSSEEGSTSTTTNVIDSAPRSLLPSTSSSSFQFPHHQQSLGSIGTGTPSASLIFNTVSGGMMPSNKFGFSYNGGAGNGSASSSPWPTYGSSTNNASSSKNGATMQATSSSAFLMQADTPPIAPNSILFSPAGLPPRHQPMLDSSSNNSYPGTLPTTNDYFTLISPSGTVQALPNQGSQQQQQQEQQQAQPNQPSESMSTLYPTMIRPSDLMLHSSSLSSSSTNSIASVPKLSHLNPLSDQSQNQQLQGYIGGGGGPFSRPALSTQPSNLSHSTTLHDTDSAPSTATGIKEKQQSCSPSHTRGLSNSSFTSTISSLATDSLTWSPSGSPTGSSFGSSSQSSSFQSSDNFMSQNILLDKRPVSSSSSSGAPPHHHAYPSSSNMYGHHYRQNSYPSKGLYRSPSYGLIQQDIPPPYYVHPAHMRQSPLPMPMHSHNQHAQPHQYYHHHHQQQQQYLRPIQDHASYYGRDSVSPVQMSLSPEPSSSLPDLTLQGTQGITPTRSTFNVVAPTPRLPSLMRRSLLNGSTPASSDDGHGAQDEDDLRREETVADALDRTVQARDQHHEYYHSSETERGRHLRRGRAGRDSLSMSSTSLAQSSMSPPEISLPSNLYAHSHTQQQHHHRDHNQSGIVLPSKIKSLGTLPADEAFSSSLDQLDDVPPGTKPPYLWWTLIRAAILGAPGQTLQMETLTQLIQQKYPYFGTAKEAKNWKSSIRSVIHTKPCFYKSEDEAGNVWWHVDVDIDPREQRRGMKKRSSISNDSQIMDPNSLGSVQPKHARKNSRGAHEMDNDDQDDGVIDDTYFDGSAGARKRRKSG